MKEYTPHAGEDITKTAEQMVKLAKRTKDTVKAKFNDIELTVTSDSTADAIAAYYGEESDRRSEAYRNSPEGKRAERERQEHVVTMQQKHDALMQQLPSLNFADDVAVLDWLCEFQDPSDHCGVAKQQSVVLATFAKHGYQPSVNCGKDFNKDDRNVFVHWLVGQALAGLACDVGAIHQVFHKFADDFKKKFLVEA